MAVRGSFVLVLLLAGCLAGPAGDEGEADGSAGPMRFGVVLYNEEFQAGPMVEVSSLLDMPEGARNVRAEVTAYANTAGSVTATVGLAGCGEAEVRFSGWAEVLVMKDAVLCEKASAGSRSVTMATNGAPMAGRLLLRADLPG